LSRSRFRVTLRFGGRRKKRRSRKAQRRARRLLLVKLGLVAAVGIAVGLLVLHVNLGRRFEGRLWMLPSQIYSDTLEIHRGSPVGIEDLVERLRRTGYGETQVDPSRPGQFRKSRAALEVYLRPQLIDGRSERARRLRLRFDRHGVSSIHDALGNRLGRVELEAELLATLFGPRQEERVPLALDDVPLTVRNAVLAAEDARFERHHGLDLRGILRAGATNVRHGRVMQGGSTITQQTVKNIFLDQRRSWWRKAKEALMALMLDARYSKERILEVYLNEVYLGQRGPVAICGVQAASRFYFGRDVADLSLGESALLAGMIRSPGGNNPFRHPVRSTERREQVIRAMLRLEMIDAGQAKIAAAEPLQLASGESGFTRAAYAVDHVKAQLTAEFSDVSRRWEGLKVYTTIDTLWQARAEREMRIGLERLEAQRRVTALQGAIVVIEPRSGAIRAMVGGREYGRSQFNRAVQARRQPGSCFKPFVYATGFEKSVRGEKGALTPATMLDDSPLEMISGGKQWRPANYDGEFRGPVSARTALEQSLNVPTVRAAQHVGIESVINTARQMGIDSRLKPVPSLALGVMEVSPLELATGYATLARSGLAGDSHIIRHVTDSEGQVLYEPRREWHQAISPQAAHLVNHLLRGVFEHGTARSASRLGYRGRASGKTGTTDDMRDAWFVGYTSEVLALVWVGRDDNGQTGLTGSSGALPIWAAMMREAGPTASPRADSVPNGIVTRRIDPESGLLARRGCDNRIDEHFVRGTEPQRDCSLHGGSFRRWFDRLRRKPRYQSDQGV